MRVNIIVDSDGDYGMGHIVRQHRLAQVLRQRGADVNFYLQSIAERGSELVKGFFVAENIDPDTHCSVIIVDRMENDDETLEQLRQFCNLLVVFVGVGNTITPDTYWIADYVIQQNMVGQIRAPKIFQDKRRAGKDWLILSPSLRNAEYPKERTGIPVVYFGGGVDEDVILSSIPMSFLRLGSTTWMDDVGRELLRSSAFVGTMGMIAYEAIAAGLRPLVVSRDEDHNRTAEQLQGIGMVWDLGLAEDWDVVAKSRALEILSRPRDLQVENFQRPDGWGAWRIAELLLNG